MVILHYLNDKYMCVLLDVMVIHNNKQQKKYAWLHLIQVIITRSLLDNNLSSINSSFVTAIVLQKQIPIMALLNLLVTFTLCPMISISESKDLFTVPRTLLPFFEIFKSSYGYMNLWHMYVYQMQHNIYVFYSEQTWNATIAKLTQHTLHYI